MRYGRIILIAALIWSSVSVLQARTYYLPDYQSEFIYGSRVNNDDSGQHTSTPSCSSFGYYSAPQSNADCDRVTDPAPGLICYSCSTCSAEYVYDNSNCSGDYVLSGTACSGKYSQCICDRAKFPVSSGSGCPSGQKIDTSASCKAPSDTETFYNCIEDPCAGLTEKSACESSGKICIEAASCSSGCSRCVYQCELAEAPDCGSIGCETYYADCPDKCQTCRAEVSCESGFHPSADKLSCVADACTGYDLTTPPANAVYESCQSGNTLKYKLTSCSSGYRLNAAGTACEAKVMTCEETLLAADIVPVSTQADYEAALQQNKEVVLMNDLSLTDYEVVYGDDEDVEYYWTYEIRNNIYTLASLHDRFAKCPNTTARLSLYGDMEEPKITGAPGVSEVVIYPAVEAIGYGLTINTDTRFMGGTPEYTTNVTWIDSITLTDGVNLTLGGGKKYYIGYGIYGEANNTATVESFSELISDSAHYLDELHLESDAFLTDGYGAVIRAASNTVITPLNQTKTKALNRVPLDCWEDGNLYTNTVLCRGTIEVKPECPDKTRLALYRDVDVGHKYYDFATSATCMKNMTQNTALLKCGTGYTEIDKSNIDRSLEGINLGVSYTPQQMYSDGCYGCFNTAQFKADKISCNQSMQSAYNSALSSCQNSGEYGINCDEFWILDGMCEMGGDPDVESFNCCDGYDYHYQEYFQNIALLSNKYVCREYSGCSDRNQVVPAAGEVCTGICNGKCIFKAKISLLGN